MQLSLRFPLALAVVSITTLLPAQTIRLDNASFEGTPQDAVVPAGWFECTPGTTPDILPGPWGVYTEPSDGDTFVGLITRPDGSFESIGQRLRQPLRADQFYCLEMDVARSDTYSGYAKPVKLRVYASLRQCGTDQLLIETEFIQNLDWETLAIQFTATANFNYIRIEAHYRDGDFSHAGNLLIDNISVIKACEKA